MGKKGFDLAALAREAMGAGEGGSELEKVPELRMIPFDRIRPDPDNGYSLEGIEELAGNIETVGLLDPLVVLPETSGGWPLLSGHRRHAAIRAIIEGGSHMFDGGVPCLVKPVAVQEGGDPRIGELVGRLTLLLANSDNRKMTSADQNQQAERLEAVVAELAELGFPFPGRRRDWVAQLSGMSRSKLARLKVIREKLDPPIRKKYYDKGKLSEETAYELARLPVEHQRRTMDWYLVRNTDTRYMYAGTVKKFGEDLARLGEYTCPKPLPPQPCVNREAMMERIWSHGYRGYTYCSAGSRCCAGCLDLASCRSVCAKLRDKADQMKREKRAAQKQQREEAALADAPAAEKVRRLWLRFGDALSRAEMKDEELRKRVPHTDMYQLKPDVIRALETGEYEKVKGNMVLPYSNAAYLGEIERLVGIADTLGCSLDWLFCRTDVPAADGPGVSESDTGGGPEVHWHRTAPEDMPPEYSPPGSAILLWGEGGLHRTPDHLVAQTIRHMPESAKWWAVIKGPEEENE